MRLSSGLLLLLSCVLASGAEAVRPPLIEAVAFELRMRNPDAAVEAADKAVAALPSSAEAWHIAAGAYGMMAQRASVFSKLSWAKKCRLAYERAAAIDPRHFAAQMGLLQYYLMAPGIAGGGRDKADALAITISSLDAGWGHSARAALARADKDEAGYEREARAAIAASPAEPRLRVDFVVMMSSKERWNDAFQILDEGLALSADDVRLNYHIGRLAAMSGLQLERGLAALEKASKAQDKPDDFSEGGLVWRRALILEKLGRKAEALPELQRALKIEPALKEQVEKDIARLQKA